MKKKLIFLMMVIMITLSACSTSNSTNQENPTIYTTSYGIELLVEAVAGEDVQVENVYPQGVDSHSYEFTTKELQTISDSDIVFYGSKEEDQSISKLAKQDDDDTEYIDLSKTKEFTDNYGKDLENPHIWLTPKSDLILAKPIKNTLVKSDPDHEQEYEKNYNILKKELEDVDKEYKEFAQTQKKDIVVSHDAFYYYKKDYGIDYVPIYGAEHDDEPSSGEIKQIIDNINDNEIPVLYVSQNEENTNVINQIQNSTDTNIEILNDLDSASTDTTFKDMDLVQILEYNIDVLKDSQK